MPGGQEFIEFLRRSDARGGPRANVNQGIEAIRTFRESLGVTDSEHHLSAHPQGYWRQNLVLRADAFDHAYWVKTAVTITPDQAVGPLGVLDADQATVTNATHELRSTAQTLAAARYTFSFYALNNGGTQASYSVYNFTTASNIIAPTSYIGLLSNTVWVRVPVSFTLAAEGSVAVYPVRDSGADVNLYLWGAQLEIGGAATRYQRTIATPEELQRGGLMDFEAVLPA